MTILWGYIRYAEELADGLSKAEAMIKADKAADDYIVSC